MSTPIGENPWGIPHDNDPAATPAAQQPPTIDLEELTRAVAGKAERAKIAEADRTEVLEAAAAISVQGWAELQAKAEQNRADIDGAIQQMTSPLVTLFRGQLTKQTVQMPKPKRLGTIAGIPPLDEDPRAWREYMEKHCAFAKWNPGTPHQELFVAGLPQPDGTLELVGFGSKVEYIAGPAKESWMQVHDGRVVVGHQHRGKGGTTFVTGIPGDPEKPPVIPSTAKPERHKAPLKATYNAEKDRFDSSDSNPWGGHDLLLGLCVLGEICEGMTPTVKGYKDIAHALHRRKYPLPRPQY